MIKGRVPFHLEEQPRMAVNLATAYIELIPSARGINSSVQKQFEPAGKIAEQAGQESGERFTGAAAGKIEHGGSRIGGALKKGLVGTAKVTGLAVGGILGVALTKGFSRLSSIENAQAKLKGFGHSADAVTGIMKNALASVKGTAFGLDEAATTAAGAVAAGIKPGEQLERVLKVVSNSAGAAGTSMGDMGAIFNKVATTNKAQNDVLNQVADKGINIYGELANAMGVTNAEVFKLASDGKINFATFEKAMTAASGTAADELGKTTTGSLANVTAALGRLGAGLLGGIFPALAPTFGSMITWIDKVTDVAGPLATKVTGGLITGLTGVYNILAKGDFTGPIFGLQEDSKIIDFLFDLREGAAYAFGEIKGGIKAFGAAWKYNDGEITSSGLPGFMERAGYFAHQMADGFKLLDFSSFQGFLGSLKEAGGPAGKAMGSIGESLTALAPAFQEFSRQLPNIGEAVAKLAGGALNLLVRGLSFLADHVDTIIKYMPLIVGAFVAWKIASMAATSATYSLRAAELAATSVTLTSNLLRANSVRIERKNLASKIALTAATGTNTAATTVAAGASTAAATAATAQGSAVKRAGVMSKLAAAGQWLLNAALSANPIAIVVVAVAALVGAFVWFFTQTKIGQGIVTAAWTGIKNIVGGVSDWFQKTILPKIKAVLAALGAGFNWLWKNVISPVFSFIGGAIKAWGMLVGKIFEIAVAVIRLVLGAAVTWLWEKIVSPVFGYINKKISDAGIAWGIVFRAAKDFLKKTLGPAFTWLHDKAIKPAMDLISGVVDRVWTKNLKPTFDAVKTAVKTALPGAFDKGIAAIKKAWEKLRSIARAPVEFVITKVLNEGLIAGINAIAKKVHVTELPNVALPEGWMGGGYTGDGPKRKVAGPVHAGEYVFSKEQTAAMGKENLAALAHNAIRGDSLPKKLLANAAVGSPVYGGEGSFSNNLQHEINRAGRLNVVDHGIGSGWQLRRAVNQWKGASRINVNYGSGPGPEVNVRSANIPAWWAGMYWGDADEISLNDRMGFPGQSLAVSTHEIGHALGLPHSMPSNAWSIMNYNNMYKHKSVQPADARSLQKIYGGSAGNGFKGSGGDIGEERDGKGFLDVILGPFKKIADGIIGKIRAEFPGAGTFVDLAVGAGKSVLTSGLKFLTDKLGDLKNIASNIWDGAKKLVGIGAVVPGVYDNGGWLEPGGVAVNHSTRPEPIMTGKQWDNFSSGPDNGPTEMVGNLYLDSGELLGKFRGVATQVADQRITAASRAMAGRRVGI